VAAALVNKLGGNEERFEQLYQAASKFVPLEKLSGGKDVRLEQPAHVSVKVTPDSIVVGGKLVKLLQFFQVRSNKVAFKYKLS
jgi:hypothetical protein